MRRFELQLGQQIPAESFIFEPPVLFDIIKAICVASQPLVGVSKQKRAYECLCLCNMPELRTYICFMCTYVFADFELGWESEPRVKNFFMYLVHIATGLIVRRSSAEHLIEQDSCTPVIYLQRQGSEVWNVKLQTSFPCPFPSMISGAM